MLLLFVSGEFVGAPGRPNREEMRVRSRLVKIRRWAWKLAIPAVGVAVVSQLAFAGAASANHTSVHHATAGVIRPAKVNMLDCNGWSQKYKSAAPGFKHLCTDPLKIEKKGDAYRFTDNGHYVGHDEPSVKFISNDPGSGNTMSYAMRLPKDPSKAPTANGSVTKYGELSIAPWFGLNMCDPKSFPQKPCTPDSDTNTGALGDPNAAGSAFMELQFYPPGFAPFIDGVSCSQTRWCAALTIDSLECNSSFACNNNCIEPVNFSFLQTNGVPPGPPAPQRPSVGTFFGNSHTLKMKPGDALAVQITDPASGFTARVTDFTSHTSGFIQASAKNGFTNTNISNCSGSPHTWHAEYNTAQQQNTNPWAALESGVLMQQEVGHFESCSSVIHQDGFSANLSHRTSYRDPKAAETCKGGMEGRGKVGEGPCSLTTGNCQHAMTQGAHGPVACPKRNFTSGALCEFADGFCFPKGSRTVRINGHAAKEHWPVAGCIQTQFQNGDLDFEGNTYRADWPNGSSNFPQTFRYAGPLDGNGKPYPQVQFETDAGGSERLCNPTTGARCTAPPIGAKFYPFWSLTKKQSLAVPGVPKGFCLWNFGNVIKGVTTNPLGRDKQYGAPNTARFGGTIISKVEPNPELSATCA
jgi:hypothetical protein